MTEQETKHTLGPWEWDDEYGDNWRVNEASTGNALAVVLGTADNLQPGQREANAHLIAAAPLMLEALQEVEYLRQGGDYIPACPACGRAKHDCRGHKDDCKLNAAIKTATKRGKNHGD